MYKSAKSFLVKEIRNISNGKTTIYPSKEAGINDLEQLIKVTKTGENKYEYS